MLDPFVGSGTVAVEAARLGRRAVGFEINPAAALMAKVYELCNVAPKPRLALLDRVETRLDQGSPGARWPAQPPVYSAVPADERVLLDALVIMAQVDGPAADATRVRATWRRLRSTVTSLPHMPGGVRISMADARVLPLDDDSVDFVCTSPPYINVFNYHQQFRRSVEYLGWDVLDVARSELGSNRKHRGNRLLTVVQYCLDMQSSLAQMRRVCRSGASMVLVIGRESNVRKTAFYNGSIIHRVAEEAAGLRVELQQERVFKNKFGKQIYEDILVLRAGPQKPAGGGRDAARAIAIDALREAAGRAPPDVASDFRDAIIRGSMVEPSPFFAGPKNGLWRTGPSGSAEV